LCKAAFRWWQNTHQHPQTVANLWVSYALTPTWTASAGVRHVGKVYANAANTQHWPAYTLLDRA
jgi:iron complex outermembrane receptor protein